MRAPPRLLRQSLLCGLLLLAIVPEAWACPVCNYERMLLSNWYPKVWILKLSLPLLFSFTRLDPVRVLYAFLPYVYGYIVAFKYLIWFGHPAVSDGAINSLAGIGLALLMFNVLDAALLFGLGCIPFFRRDKTKGLPLLWAIAFAVAACAIGWPLLGRV